ncbi:hypothetical protein OG250_12050 [Streptomyces sp. NBC_00487]|uniref:hypothetical protein n=1 Tax=unclassified Streptomyces TaxID=2593676 RepID=UPI002DD85214|nr:MULTISPECIES: hypothetical protein [unclassified Streptomyces]WRY95535.1 hypothetical protein OG889_12810 [Streptomyces sp. NBC_00481]
MFEYELQQIRSAELIREAEQYRRVREARRARRDERNEEGRVPHERPRRLRFPRAA